MLNSESRVKNSARNAVFSMSCQIITLLCTFITRTIFIRYLGSSYLGINGLFTNILTVLSIADLGFDTAVIYSLYKPIADNDEKKLNALVNYFKKVYIVIGILIAITGICFIPFLGYLVNLETAIENVTIYYILYLLDTVFTYFLANRTAIISADQKLYVIKKYTLFFKIIQSICQIIALICFKNFLVYLIIQIICTFSTNLYGAIKVKKMYPFLKDKQVPLEKKEKKEIFSNVRSMFVYKIGGVVLNNTDNILISILITTEMVGLYSNYTMIINAVQAIVVILFTSMLASVGNLNATSTIEKRKNVFYKIDFLAVWIYGITALCIMILCNDFINIMWGKEYVLSNLVLIAALINYLIVGYMHPLRLYRETTGVFKEVKYIFICTSILNLIFSIVLGYKLSSVELKLFGIIIATAIARVLTTVWFEPKKIFNNVFKEGARNYLVNKLKDISILIVNVVICYYITNLVLVRSWITLILKGIICFGLSNVIFMVVYYKQENFKYFKEQMIRIVSHIREKNKEKN